MAKSGRLELGDNILRTLYINLVFAKSGSTQKNTKNKLKET